MATTNLQDWLHTKIKWAAQLNMGQSPDSDTVSDNLLELPSIQGNAEFGELHPIPRKSCAVAPKKAQEGDILISVRDPVGALNIADQGIGIGRGLCALQPLKGRSDQMFLWYVLHA